MNNDLSISELFYLIGTKEVRIALLEKQNKDLQVNNEYLERKAKEFAQEIDRLKNPIPDGNPCP